MSGCDCSSLFVPIFDCIKCILCFFAIERAKYFDKLEKDLKELRNYKEQLEEREQRERRKINRGNALNERVEDEEKSINWVEEVSNFQDDSSKMVKEAEEELRQKAIRWFFPRDCFSYTKVGDKTSSELERATGLIKEYNYQTEPSNPSTEIDMSPKLVGFESKFDEIWTQIENPAVKISGLYGRGGVGKTTLLQMIYDRLLKRSNTAIWVEMRKEDPVGLIQEAIRQNFAISQEYWAKKTGTKDIITKLLRKEKFYLLLDDVNSHHLGSNFLEEAGVPLGGHNNGSKVIFSTRSEDVCYMMKAKEPIEVEPMTNKNAIELLEFHLGQGTLKAHPQIKKFAEDIAQLCNGLPLLLTKVGDAMAGEIDPAQWIHAIQTLQNDLSQFKDMETMVLNVLKIGYDMLPDDSSQKCCLYFSVLPEVKRIKVEELVEQWIGEGFLDKSDDDIYVARKKGAEIIRNLKLVGLLERGESGDFFKMHDEIHSMTLWLARPRVLVQHEEVDYAEWTDAKWISLFGPKIKITANGMQHPFRNLTTLLVRSTNLETIPSGFFRWVPKLKVLDLSDNNSLADLPINNEELGNLQYLNLSGTSIKKFPAGVQNWTKSLRIFIVSACLIITPEMISTLCLLRVIRMLSSMDDEIAS